MIPYEKYMNAVEGFASEAYNRLRDEGYGVGSDVIEAMAISGLSGDEIGQFLQQILETFEDIPDEAKGLAHQDDFWKNIIELSTMIHEADDIVDIRDVLETYMTSDDLEGFKEALQNYLEYDGDKPQFSELWSDLSGTLDPGNPDTMEELIKERNGETDD